MTDEKCKWFSETGFMSEEGKSAFASAGFNMGLAALLDSDEVADMTINELRILQSNLNKIVSEAVSNRIISKQQTAAKLNDMTNEQFEEYMDAKYGKRWRLMAATPEELDRVPVLTQERVEELLKEGAKHVSDFHRSGLILPDRNPRFGR